MYKKVRLQIEGRAAPAPYTKSQNPLRVLYGRHVRAHGRIVARAVKTTSRVQPLTLPLSPVLQIVN
jgi:hypothetical protein